MSAYCPTCNGRFDDGGFCPKDGTALIAEGEQQQSLAGQVIDGRYRLTTLLGQGGMGEVYVGEHIRITKKVAIKFLHHEISADPEALGRFQQEAQSASSIGHRNIVTIDDFGTLDDGRVFLCMEYLAGVSMSDAMLAPGGLEPVRALNLMGQVCDGLSAAHAKGIVHRDMKPENVFITQPDDMPELVKILDFGIAKVISNDEQNLTKTGTVFGTPHYMSPEQAMGQKDRIDQRADIYSMGVMLFEIFTGQLPFKAESFMGILSQHITAPPPAPNTVTPGKNIPQQVEEVILKAMAKEPEQRFATAAEMRGVLDSVRETLAPGSGTYQPTPSAPPAIGVATGVAQPGGQPSIPATMAAVPTGPGMAAAPSGPQAAAIPATMAGVQTGPNPMAQPQTGPGMQPQVAGGYPATGPGMQPGGAQVPVITAPVTPHQPKKGNAGLIIGLIVGLVILLGGGGAAAYFLGLIPGTGKDGDTVAAVDGDNNGDSSESSGEGKASGGDKKPEEGDKKPEEGDKKPEEGDKKPEEGDEKPADGDEKPKEGDKKPADGDKKPEEGDKKPADGDKKPGPPKSEPKPWHKKGPALAGMDRGTGIATLLDSCRLHREGGNISWAEAACVAGIKKAEPKKDRRLKLLYYRLGLVYEGRRRYNNARLAYEAAAKLGYGPAKTRLKRVMGKLGN